MKIEQVIISDDLIEFLEKRHLSDQYRKAKAYILIGNFRQVSLKLREPKKLGVYYFRINQQYRALCYLNGNILKIFDVDNHQN